MKVKILPRRKKFWKSPRLNIRAGREGFRLSSTSPSLSATSPTSKQCRSSAWWWSIWRGPSSNKGRFEVLTGRVPPEPGVIEIIGKINKLLIPVFIMKLKVLSLERGEERARMIKQCGLFFCTKQSIGRIHQTSHWWSIASADSHARKDNHWLLM